MTTFNYTVNVSEQPKQQAALGVDANNKLDENDVDKLVKLAANQNYVVASTGNDIEGQVVTVEPFTVNDGFSFGTVAVGGRMQVEVAAAEVGTLAIGDFVVAGIQGTIGTKTPGYVIAGAGSVFKWRVIRHVTGAGDAGDTVLIERVS